MLKTTMSDNHTHKETFFNIRCDLLICLFLIIAILAIYGQVRNYAFITLDDDDYVAKNPHVRAGLTSESIVYAFSSTEAANWHPVTWLSHMLDVQLWGMNPGQHHLTNVLFHIANTLLLFSVLRRMTGDLWQSAFVAALFALHPLRAESVAWISERKDVLSAFFWMLTLWSYVRYVEHPGRNEYLLTILFFMLGLMSKPMLVTLPFVLILLDYWPLRRLKFKPSPLKTGTSQFSLQSSVLEKTPFFVLTVASSVITLLVQKGGGAVASLEVYPFHVRVGNALVSYISYIGKMIWPSELIVFYPHPGVLPGGKVAGAGLLIVSISLLAIILVKRMPCFIVGWLWYLGTLVPVIGLVQVGSQAMADRYTYIPLIGLSVIIAWGVPRMLVSLPPTLLGRYGKKGIAIISAAMLLMLMTASYRQVQYWKNTLPLFEHVLDVNPGSSRAHYNMGIELANQGRLSEAVSHYSEVLRINPNHARAHNNIGIVLTKQDKTDEAIRHFSRALRSDPDYTEAHYNMGIALANQGKTDEAIRYYLQALRLDPDDPEVCNNLGAALLRNKKLREAAFYFQKALQKNPDYTEARNNLKKALAARKDVDRAVKNIRETLKNTPGNPDPYYQIGNLYRKHGEVEQAIAEYQKALSVQPEFVPALNNLAVMYAVRGEYDQAISLLEKVTELQPDNADAYYYIACIYARQKKTEKSVDWLKKSVEKGYKNWEFLKTDSNLENIRGSSYYQSLVGPSSVVRGLLQPATGNRQPTTDHRPPTTNHRQPTTDNRQPTTDK
ncbi:tetratricopeptide repeat protein [Desulfobacterales bacterium HSG2]|nr:tetratricopeptide repeat protein [Desulfobacterales bacterium HSG2]